MKVVNSITELIGNTPVIKLNKIVSSDHADVFVKLEMFNPSKSVKDRAAYHMIRTAEEQGLISPGDTIIEPTSGNTGIGLAMIAASKGYEAILVMPDNMTKERINLLQAYGARVVLTPRIDKMPGAIKKAKDLQQSIPHSFIPQQFENEANAAIHRDTTAWEIYEQMDGKLDAFIATAGTGGTITGTGEVLKEKIPQLKIAVVEPDGSPVLSGGKPGNHNLVGTSPGFIPHILNEQIYDEIIRIKDEDAVSMYKEVARQEGVFIGLSGAAAIFAALEVAKKLGKGKRVLCIAPDTGERYLSMNLFDSISRFHKRAIMEHAKEVIKVDWKQAIDDYIRHESKLAGALVGLSVRCATTQEKRYERMGDQRLQPASNMKLVTGAAALAVLGEDHRFSTELWTDGKIGRA